MHQPTSLALLGAIYSFTLAAAGSVPRGVGPEFASYYTDKTQFSCITNAAIKLSLSQVNDNSCDCPDGSDEPGTAACAHIDSLSPEQPLFGSTSGTTNASNALPGFYCANVGHEPAYVPFAYVNDGVCDYDLCCDGSEEFAHKGGVKCENRCAEIGKEHRRKAEEQRKNMEKAAKKRNAMVKEAQELRKKAESNVASLQEEVARLEKKKAELELKYEEVQRTEKGKAVKSGEDSKGGKLAVLSSVAKARVQELRNTLDDVVTQRNDLQGRVNELETILRKFKEEYNPNFNDEGVKAAVKSFEDYSTREDVGAKDRIPDAEIEEILKEDSETRGVNWQEFEDEEGSDTDILYSLEAYLPAFARDMIHGKLNAVRVWLIENGLLADNAKAGSESQLVRAAREAFEAAERDVNTKNRERDQAIEEVGRDYGPSDIFRALKDKCVSTDSGEYTYELCWMGKTAQNSKKGHGHTNMGNFQRIDREMADDEERVDGKSLGKGERMVLRYDDGQQCWNGPKRRTDVWLGCAETEELWRVSESEKCVYKMEVGTPAACEPVDGGEGAAGKDEL